MDAHKRISFIKSFIRLVGCFYGIVWPYEPAAIFTAFVMLFVAEMVGIVEEMVV